METKNEKVIKAEAKAEEKGTVKPAPTIKMTAPALKTAQVKNENEVKIFDASGIQDLKRADIGSAGVDIRSSEDVVILQDNTLAVATGLFVELPIMMELQIRSRSGLALNNNVHVLNSPGTVDSTFRGEVKVILRNDSDRPFYVSKGDRIAQGVFAWYLAPDITKVESKEELSKTERADGGFGHTGIK
jgi:dUTP pyrophosphatase